jgi:membrane fusion protein (multidrug efflux system)
MLSTETAGVVAKVISDGDLGSERALPITIEAGTLLLELDATVERAELAAAEARSWEAKKALDRAAFLAPRQASSRSELDQAEATFRARSAEAHAIEARIARKQIRAPFRGQLGIRQVNVGSYVSPGTPIIPLYQLDTMHADFAVPQDQVSHVFLGQSVTITVAGAESSSTEPSPTKVKGTITSIDPQVDPDSRLLSVRATIANPDFRLRPGMFGTATIPLGKPVPVIPVPEPAIAFAPYGNSVFVIKTAPTPSTSTAQSAEIEQRFVTLGERRGDLIAVLSGLEPGDRFVSAGTFRLRSGMTVFIDNTLQPSAETNPKPPQT